MRIVLFDWTTGGHHSRYVQRLGQALAPIAEVVAAVPARTAAALRGVSVRTLPTERPTIDTSRALAPQHRELADQELALFQAMARELRPDHLVHMYADPVIRRLVRLPELEMPVSLLIFFARAHYPTLYRTRVSLMERARAAFQVYLLRRWRRRRDAHALLCLDEGAVEWLSRWRGAPVRWFPEPPVEVSSEVTKGSRYGCIMYGSLAPRKGIDLLARALAASSPSYRVVVAGAVEPGFQAQLDACVADMRRAGVNVELRARAHTETEGLELLAQAQCAVLPYPNHNGPSRVLLEAATVGTPVVVHDHGLLAHLVRTHGLGLAVDCRDASALQSALARLCGEPTAAHYVKGMREFAARYSEDTFSQRVRAVFVRACA
jgi:glycosyl transferase family 1